MKHARSEIVVRALRTQQGDRLDVYAFFIRGADIVKVADITRVERDDSDVLKGFQRPEIRNHVKGIVDYLNQGSVLFPNAIILAMSPEVHFAASRGTKPTGDEGITERHVEHSRLPRGDACRLDRRRATTIARTRAGEQSGHPSACSWLCFGQS